ncbi:putative F-box protein At3g21130 [Silene latifolia]|uniref:putative F-box protein At3g21130 n=1 Tax=Silene latifolia TaxID=37657 RepID=UPI003D787FF3
MESNCILSDDLLVEILSRLTTPIETEQPYGYNVRCIGVVNGIVCLQWGNKEIGFWNPATRDFKLIEYYHLNLPRRAISVTLQLIGFGFDIVSNDFKVVGVNRWWGPGSNKINEKHCKVYSVTANTWKKINAPPAIFSTTSSRRNAFLKGVCYWPTKVFSECGHKHRDMIVSFNFIIEVFEIFELPKDACLAFNNGWWTDWTIQLYMESIALIISKENSEAGENIVDIWIATKFDDDSRVPLSWEHLFTFPLTPTFSTIWVYGSRNHVKLIIQIHDENLEATYYCSLYNPSISSFV